MDNNIMTTAGQSGNSASEDSVQPIAINSDDLERRIKLAGLVLPSEAFGYPPFQFGSLIYKSFFPAESLSLPEIAFVDWTDKVNKGMHLGDSRDMGGPYEAHTDDMVRVYVKECKKTGITPDYVTIASILLHDFFEEHRDIKGLSRIYKNLKIKEKKSGLEYESQESLELKTQIKRKRLEIGREFLERAEHTVKAIALEYGLNTQETEKMNQDVLFSLVTADWLTRHTEERYFRASMGLLYKVHKGDDAGKILTTFQIEAMNRMGVNPREDVPWRYWTQRALLKIFDRIVLSEERRPRFNGEARKLEGILRKDPELGRVYGDISFKAKEIPAAYDLNLIYRNFVVMHFLNIGLNMYGARIYKDRPKGKENEYIPYQQLVLIDRARKRLFDVTGNVIKGLSGHYEEVLGARESRRIREAVHARVRRDPSSIRHMTGEGPITRGIGLDNYTRKEWADIEKMEFEQNYRDTIVYGFLLRNFRRQGKNGHPNEVRYSSSGPEYFNLFHIGGLQGETFVPRRTVP